MCQRVPCPYYITLCLQLLTPSILFHLPSPISSICLNLHYPVTSFIHSSFNLSGSLSIAKMAFLGKYQHTSPPTSIVPVSKEATSLPLDLEKSHVRLQPDQRHILPDTERNVIRKMDFRIVPLVTACYILAFLDRSNIGKYVILELAFHLFKLHIFSLEARLTTSIFSSLFQALEAPRQQATLTAK